MSVNIEDFDKFPDLFGSGFSSQIETKAKWC